MVVYVVTKGEYSDYGIYAIYNNKEAAENHAYNISDKWSEGRVEEYEMNAVCEKMRPRWCGLMLKSGDVEYSGKTNMDDEPHIRYYPKESMTYSSNPYAYISYSIEAETEEKAVKIMNEKRVQLIAMGFWDNPQGEQSENGYYDLK